MMQDKNLFRMIKYFFRCKKATICAMIMIVMGLALGIVTPICNKLLQQDVIPNKNLSLFIWLTIVILILNVVTITTTHFITRIFISNGIPITSNIRKDIVKMNIFSDKNKDHKGKVLLSSATFLEDGNAYYISYMYLIFDGILKLMFYLPFFIFYGGKLSLIMMLSAIISFLFIAVADKFCRRCMQKSRFYDAERYDYTLKLVKAMEKPDFKENEELNLETYMKKVKDFDRAWLHYCNWANAYPYIFNLVWYVAVGICFCLAYNMMAVGTIVLSTFIIFNSYLDQIKAPISNFASYKLMAVRYEETLKKVFEMLDDVSMKDLDEKSE